MKTKSQIEECLKYLEEDQEVYDNLPDNFLKNDLVIHNIKKQQIAKAVVKWILNMKQDTSVINVDNYIDTCRRLKY